MATITIAGAAVFVGGAVGVVARVIAENNPLVKAERKCWAKDHVLDVDQAKQAALHALVAEHFQKDNQIELCVMILSAAGLQYEHW